MKAPEQCNRVVATNLGKKLRILGLGCFLGDNLGKVLFVESCDS